MCLRKGAGSDECIRRAADSDEMERRLIGSMLLQTAHNKTRAAEKLGISLRTLRNKLRPIAPLAWIRPSPSCGWGECSQYLSDTNYMLIMSWWHTNAPRE